MPSSIGLNLLILGGLMLYQLGGRAQRSTTVAFSERINHLASPSSIRSKESALLYVNTFADAWGADDQSFRYLRERIASAELLSVQDPGVRIPEDRIAKAFNTLMNELGAAQEMRITGKEVQHFRSNFFRIANAYPNMLARRADGSLDDRCRPVEALYLIFLLQFGPNLEASRSSLTVSAQQKGPSVTRVTLRAATTREKQYSAAVDQYFRTHSVPTFNQTLNQILDELLGSSQ
jgi:hypothetical protein